MTLVLWNVRLPCADTLGERPREHVVGCSWSGRSYVVTARITRRRAAAELRRSATVFFGVQCPSNCRSIT
jgi:hypothetical protein